MANCASDARASEQELRKQLIESRAVDVMLAAGPKMFYTVTLPCTLWFLEKGNAAKSRKDTVLFIDARHIYRQIDRAHRDWTPAQIGFIANIVRLYRGEEPHFTLGGNEVEATLKEVFGEEPQYIDVAGLCKAALVNEIPDVRGEHADIIGELLRIKTLQQFGKHSHGANQHCFAGFNSSALGTKNSEPGTPNSEPPANVERRTAND